MLFDGHFWWTVILTLIAPLTELILGIQCQSNKQALEFSVLEA